MDTSVRDLAARPSAMAVDGFEVLDEFHRQCMRELDRLAMLAQALAGGEADPAARATAREIVHHFCGASRRHHQDEEIHVFPGLMQGSDAAVRQAVLRLQQDHFWIEEDWRQIEPLLCAVAEGQSWVDMDLLRECVEVFVALMHDHIALEESLIYPQARRGLSPAQRLRMGREMSRRRRLAHSRRRN